MTRELEEKIGHRVRNEAILRRALTHSSYANEEFARSDKVVLLSSRSLESRTTLSLLATKSSCFPTSGWNSWAIRS